MCAKLFFIIGCMFSGKSTELLKIYSEYDENKSLLIKSKIDTRYSKENIITHDNNNNGNTGYNMKANYVLDDIDMDDKLFIKNVDRVENIFIDEGHFFSNLFLLIDYLKDTDKNIYIAALDLTYEKKPFKNIEKCMNTFNVNIVQKKARCDYCNGEEKAIYSILKRNVIVKDNILVGGSDEYAVICNECDENNIK